MVTDKIDYVAGKWYFIYSTFPNGASTAYF